MVEQRTTEDENESPIPESGNIEDLYPLVQELNWEPQDEIVVSQTAEVLDVLNVDTARKMLVYMQTEPRTSSELSELLDITPQAVHYHLQKLEDVGLIELIGTALNEKATTTHIYGAVARSVTIRVAPEE